jgi:hypothetical protein
MNDSNGLLLSWITYVKDDDDDDDDDAVSIGFCLE